MEQYISGAGQKMKVHEEAKCSSAFSDYCVIHNPSMTWPTLWRSDWGGFMEYTCPHGVGYPVPEDTYEHPGFGCCNHVECNEEYAAAIKKVEANKKEKRNAGKNN